MFICQARNILSGSCHIIQWGFSWGQNC
uniref:Uncharacterized protein n=1 Tax=Arundo donax TaxID=35708 RepID=A0A0A9FAJ0_ARUDO